MNIIKNKIYQSISIFYYIYYKGSQNNLLNWIICQCFNFNSMFNRLTIHISDTCKIKAQGYEFMTIEISKFHNLENIFICFIFYNLLI